MQHLSSKRDSVSGNQWLPEIRIITTHTNDIVAGIMASDSYGEENIDNFFPLLSKEDEKQKQTLQFLRNIKALQGYFLEVVALVRKFSGISESERLFLLGKARKTHPETIYQWSQFLANIPTITKQTQPHYIFGPRKEFVEEMSPNHEKCIIQGYTYHRIDCVPYLFPMINKRRLADFLKSREHKNVGYVINITERRFDGTPRTYKETRFVREDKFSDIFPMPTNDPQIFVYRGNTLVTRDELLLRIGSDISPENIIQMYKGGRGYIRNYLNLHEGDLFNVNIISFLIDPAIPKSFQEIGSDRTGKPIYRDSQDQEIWGHQNGSFVSNAGSVRKEIERSVQIQLTEIGKLQERIFRLQEERTRNKEWNTETEMKELLQRIKTIECNVKNFRGGYVSKSFVKPLQDAYEARIAAERMRIPKSDFIRHMGAWYLGNPQNEFSLLEIDMVGFLEKQSPEWKSEQSLSKDGKIFYKYSAVLNLLYEKGFIYASFPGQTEYIFGGRRYVFFSTLQSIESQIGDTLRMGLKRAYKALKNMEESQKRKLEIRVFDISNRRFETLYEYDALMLYLASFEYKELLNE